MVTLFRLAVDDDAVGGVLERLTEGEPFTTIYEFAGSWDVFVVETFATVPARNE